MTEQADLQELFFFFHDFLIRKVTELDGTMVMDIEIPWTQLVGDADNIRVELQDCHDLKCEYAIAIDTPENLSKFPGQREYVNHSTEDLQLISALLLEVQHFDHVHPDKYVLHCNSSNPRCAGGKLSLIAKAFKVYDSSGADVGMETIGGWHKEWWQKIGSSDV